MKKDRTNQSGNRKTTHHFVSLKQAETGDNGRFRIIVEILFFAITAVFKSGPLLLIFLFLTTILSGLMPTVTVFVGKLVLNAIVDVIKTETGSAEIAILVRALALQLMVLVGSALLSQASAYLNYFMGRRLSLNMNAELIKKASRLDYTFFENPHFYDMMTRAQRESNGKPLVLVYKVTSIIRGTITFISMGSLVARFSVPLLIAMVIVSLPLLFIQLRYGRKGYSLLFERTEESRMAGYVSGIMMERQYVAEILSFGLWQHLFKKWYTASQKFFRQDVQLHKQRSAAETVTATFMTCSTVTVTGYIVYACVTKALSLTVGDIMMYSGAFAGGLVGLRIAVDGVSGIYENALFLNDLVEFNKLKPHIEIRQTGKPVPGVVESIELRNVSFKYPATQKYTLKNVNLIFNRSESTLIIGANGAGKTTLIKLLTRLYDPTEGRILLNGTDIREFKIESLRRTMGVIFQEFIRYAFSANENIGCGNIADLQNTERIIAAAKRAKADSFIEQLPRQYDAILSKLFKNGQELSLGQWQRICLARLFMKDAPVLILDEPTASLDIETEAHLLREIVQLSKDKICILVSHRMLKQGIADRIVVLSEGGILETGTYESLLVSNGEFARLWKLYHNITGEQAAGSLAASNTIL